jgi:hypothetical protein
MKNWTASLHLPSAVEQPWRLAQFWGMVRAHEEMGHTVQIREWRDGMDKLYGLVAEAYTPEQLTRVKT